MSLLDKLKKARQPTEHDIKRNEFRQRQKTDEAWFLTQMEVHGLTWSSHPDLEDLELVFDYGFLRPEEPMELMGTVLADIASGAVPVKKWGRELNDAVATLEEVLDWAPLPASDPRLLALRSSLRLLCTSLPVEPTTETPAARDHS